MMTFIPITMTTAYCVKCRTKREIKKPKETKLKNGRPAIKGICPTCNTNIFRKIPYVIFLTQNNIGYKTTYILIGKI